MPVAVIAGALIDNSREDGAIGPRDAPTDSRTLPGAPSRRTAESGNATSGVEAVPRSNSSDRDESTARTPGAPGIRATIERYWRKLESHRLSSAYEDLSPKLQAAVGSESAWVGHQEADPLERVILRARVRNVERRTGLVDLIRLHTEAGLSGCSEWSGTYGLIWSGGRWLIDSVSRFRRSC
jgi:hypothetical protein